MGATRDPIKLLSRKHIYGCYRDKKWMDIYLCDRKIVMRALYFAFLLAFLASFLTSFSLFSPLVVVFSSDLLKFIGENLFHENSISSFRASLQINFCENLPPHIISRNCYVIKEKIKEVQAGNQ